MAQPTTFSFVRDLGAVCLCGVAIMLFKTGAVTPDNVVDALSPDHEPQTVKSNWLAESTPADNVYYSRCVDARAARVTPLHRGQPGYASHLDRDGDGVACEPYRGR